MAVIPERRKSGRSWRAAAINSVGPDASALDRAVAADVLLRHLFVPPAKPIEGVEYAAFYRFAEKHSGGDVIDVYRCGDGKACFSLTDISGKGVGAALHAGLVKYGIRAFSSERKSPGAVLRSLNRFYMENDLFEGSDTFASVFVAHFRKESCMLTYASAGHEAILLPAQDREVCLLNATGPLIGVFPDQPGLFEDKRLRVREGGILLAVSDGVSEARNDGALYGLESLVNVLTDQVDRSMEDLCGAVTRSAVAFTHERVIDDMAALAVRFL
jgi:sigma-B regulation protein RsbU (phosphoserine phosphatase)